MDRDNAGGRSGPVVTARVVWLALGAVARRPSLWATGLRQLRVLTPAGWWRRWPFLPLPDRRYLEFRLQTQYGNVVRAEPGDVVNYLSWCRQMRSTARPA